MVAEGTILRQSMAPKAIALSELGKTQACGNGWGAQATIEKRTVFGPKRASQDDAERDLAWAREASDRVVMSSRLEELRQAGSRDDGSAAVAAGSSVAVQEQTGSVGGRCGSEDTRGSRNWAEVGTERKPFAGR